MEPVSNIRHSPLEGRRPKRTELAGFVDGTVDDIRCPHPKLLIVGINPGLWTAAVNAPFAYPGNRFWPSLFASGLTPWQVDASYGLRLRDERMMIDRGIGLTNLVNRATAKASELNTAELRQGADRLRELCARVHPRAIAILGITAYRQAFADKSAALGLQDLTAEETGRLGGAQLWVIPQPSGLNAHATMPVLVDWWRRVADAAGLDLAAGAHSARPRHAIEAPPAPRKNKETVGIPMVSDGADDGSRTRL